MKQEHLNYLIEASSHKPDIDLILKNDLRYDDARIIYNRMHDGYPGLIIRTLNVDYLRVVVDYAFKHHIVTAIRGGGHHIGGFGTCNDGIVIDFSPFKAITIDTTNHVASVSPGATLADVDRVLCQAGYVLPTGTVSETGVGGLTLGGGIGWFIGLHGLTCDQLIGADVLLGSGQLVRAEDPEHKDLLWALRGGGGNFGIVLNYRFRLNKLPQTICGMGVVAIEHATTVMGDLIHYLQSSPREMTVAPVFTKDNDGRSMLRVDFCCAGDSWDEVNRLMELSPMISWSNVKAWDFPAWQKAFDQILLPPKRGYWKAAYLEVLTVEQIASLHAVFENSPEGDCTIMIEHLHGAFNDFTQDTSAFPLRHAKFGVLISARWIGEAGDRVNIKWVRDSFNTIDPDGASGSYLNYTSSDDGRAVRSLISANRDKIAEVKFRYDPDNCFKRNHNVLPINLALKSA